MAGRELESGNPHLVEKSGTNWRPIMWLGGAAAAGALLFGVSRGVIEAKEYVEDHQVPVGLVTAGAGIGMLKYSGNLKKSARDIAMLTGGALTLAGGALVYSEVKNADFGDEQPDAWSTTTEAPTQDTDLESDFVTVDESGNVITISPPNGFTCWTKEPHDVAPGETLTGIIQNEQGYTGEEIDALYEAAPEIGNLDTIYVGQDIVFRCDP